jgi:hypothetical protein
MCFGLLAAPAAGYTTDGNYEVHDIRDAINELDAYLNEVVSDGYLEGEELLEINAKTSFLSNLTAVNISEKIDDPISDIKKELEDIFLPYSKEFDLANVDTTKIELLPEDSDVVRKSYEELINSNLTLSTEIEKRLKIRGREISTRLANNESLTVNDLVSLNKILSDISPQQITEEKINGIKEINTASRKDIEYLSRLYNIPAGKFYPADLEEIKTDDVIMRYTGCDPLMFSRLDKVPHNDKPFDDIEASIVSTGLTGLFFYLGRRNKSYAYQDAHFVALVTGFCELVLLDALLEDLLLPYGRNGYLVASAVRVLPPALLGGYYGGRSLLEGVKNFKDERTGLRPR